MKLCSRDDVLDTTKGLLENDALRIKLTMEIPNKLGKALATLVDSAAFSDVKLVVDGTEVPAHRNILSARSQYFNGMFASKMKESVQGEVLIDDVPACVFRQLLRFIYTDDCDYNAPVVENDARISTAPVAPLTASEGGNGSNGGASSDSKEEKQTQPQPARVSASKRKRAQPVLDMTSLLLAAADRFQVPDLKANCAMKLGEGLTAKNAAERLLLADRHSAPDLKNRILEFVHDDKARLAEVMDSDAYQEFRMSLVHDLLAATLPIPASARDKAALIKSDVPGLSFSELRAELADRGLETSGLKDELVERLQNSLAVGP